MRESQNFSFAHEVSFTSSFFFLYSSQVGRFLSLILSAMVRPSKPASRRTRASNVADRFCRSGPTRRSQNNGDETIENWNKSTADNPTQRNRHDHRKKKIRWF